MTATKAKRVQPMHIEPLLVGPSEAARLLGMSVSTFYQLCSSGVIGPIGSKLGKKRLFSTRELREWVEKYNCAPRVKYQALKQAEDRK